MHSCRMSGRYKSVGRTPPSGADPRLQCVEEADQQSPGGLGAACMTFQYWQMGIHRKAAQEARQFPPRKASGESLDRFSYGL